MSSKNIVSNLRLKLKLLFVSQNDRELFCFVYNMTGFFPKNLSLYSTCFIHKSSSKAQKNGHNERLEFLGDAILGSITADYLFDKFPNVTEGNLTEMRAKLVNRKKMNEIGLDLHLQKHLSARVPHIKHNDAIGNCLEAFIGAIYKDQGYKKTKKFIIEKIITGHTNLNRLSTKTTNFKSEFIQYCQKNRLTFSFNTENLYSSPQSPRFKCELLLNEQKIAEAIGHNKKEAEQLASKFANQTLKKSSKNYELSIRC